MLMQDLLCLLQGRPDRHGDQLVARHYLRHPPLQVVQEPQVSVGEDADEPSFVAAIRGDRHARDPILFHQLERLKDGAGGGEGDRVDDHAALGPLDAIDFRRLLRDFEVLVHDADPAELGHGDCHTRLRDGIHRRTGQRHPERHAAGEAGGDVHLARQHARVARHEQHVVKRKRGLDVGARQAILRNSGLCFHRQAPWHFLYFLPLPHGHGSLRPTFGAWRRTVWTAVSSPPVRAGRGPPAAAAAAPTSAGAPAGAL